MLGVVLFALVAGAAVAQTCPNEAISQSDYFSGVNFRYVNDSGDSFTLCPMYNNKPSCCPGDIQAAANIAYEVGRARILLAKLEVQAAAATAEVELAVFDVMQNDVDTAFKNNQITETQYKALTDLISSVKSAYSDFIESASNDFIKCLESILTYLAGTLCLACDPDSEKYVIVNADNITLIISETTCDSMNGGCIDFFLTYVRLVVDLYNAVADFDSALGIATPDANITSSWPQQCGWTQNTTDGFECKNYICTEMLQGANAGTPDLSQSSRPALRAIDARIGAHVALSRPLHRSSPAKHASMLSRMHKSAIPRRAATQYTSVSENGADVYSLGEQSNLDTSATNSSSSAAWTLTNVVDGLF